MGLVKSPKECLVCLDSIETVFVPTEESQKVFNICCSYVKGAINIELLINNIIGNNSKLSFCKNCLGYSLIISQHVEEIAKLKKEIDDLSSSFLETIEKQRIKSKATTKDADKNQFSNINTKHTSNNAGNDSTDRISDSLIQLKDSGELIIGVNSIATDISSENVKTECDGIFVEYEDETCTANVPGYNEEEYESNYLVTESENEVDPFREIDLDQTYGIANNCNNIEESNPQNATPNSLAESVSTVTMSNIGLRRNKKYTFKSRTSYPEKPGLTFKKSLPGATGRNCNSTTKVTNLKSKKGKIRKKSTLLHTCPICQKSFCASADLRRHYRTHTGEKPYKCNMCEKAYTQSGDLKIHKRVHTGERPYKCSVCDRAFTRLNTMKIHEKKHNVKPCKCPHCEIIFGSADYLKDHECTHADG